LATSVFDTQSCRTLGGRLYFTSSTVRYADRGGSLSVKSVEPSELSVERGPPTSGYNLVCRKSADSNHLQKVNKVFLYYNRSDDELASVQRNSLPLAKGDLVLHASRAALVNKALKASAGQQLAFGFDDTCRKVDILIVMASIIGTCLLESGAARCFIDSMRGFVNEKRTTGGVHARRFCRRYFRILRHGVLFAEPIGEGLAAEDGK